MMSHLVVASILVIASAALGSTAPAAELNRIKVGTLAPKGSVFHKALLEMGAGWKKHRGKKARFTVYPAGSQGGEHSMVKRMKVGQLNAALLTAAVGLSDIDPRLAGVQSIPLAYRSWDEVDHVREGLRDNLDQMIEAKGYKVLFWAEAGWVHIFSKEPALTPSDYEGRKVFAWGGYPAQMQMLSKLGYHPVGLETDDLLSSLQTGLVEVAPMPAIWALAGQFERVAPHMLNIKWAPIIGAAIITEKAWGKLSVESQRVLLDGAKRAAKKIRAQREAFDRNSIAAMQKRGLNVRELTPEASAAWRQMVDGIYPQVRGSLVPEAMFDRVQALLADYRKSQ
ncbi:MAG: TRAP transporter substrate-binding protein DctP [Pseudomonadota bacterium]